MAKLYVSTQGVNLDVATGIGAAQLLTAIRCELRVRRPDGTVVFWPAGLIADSDQITHVLRPGDLPVPGTYALQARIHFAEAIVDGETTSLQVFNTFE